MRSKVTGGLLWANLHLLLWLSLFPFTTAWLTETGVATVPTVVFGVNLFAAGLAYGILQWSLKRQPDGQRLRQALGKDWKGAASPFLYLLGTLLAFVSPWLGLALFGAAGLWWLLPDRRVERFIHDKGES